MDVYWRNYRQERSSSQVEQLKQDELKSALNLQNYPDTWTHNYADKTTKNNKDTKQTCILIRKTTPDLLPKS